MKQIKFVGVKTEEYNNLHNEVLKNGFSVMYDREGTADKVIMKDNDLIEERTGNIIIDIDEYQRNIKLSNNVTSIAKSLYYILFEKYGKPIFTSKNYSVFKDGDKLIYFDNNDDTLIEDNPQLIGVINNLINQSTK
jgi:hypothetical protein